MYCNAFVDENVISKAEEIQQDKIFNHTLIEQLYKCIGRKYEIYRMYIIFLQNTEQCDRELDLRKENSLA